MTTISRRRPAFAALGAIPTALVIVLSGCASGSVGGGEGTEAPVDNSQFASIIPDGDIVQFSKDLVAGSLNATKGFTPPSDGPKAQQPGAKIAFVGSDLTNGGINAVAQGVQEAAGVIGWTVDVYDGKATAQGRTDAMNQAIASKP